MKVKLVKKAPNELRVEVEGAGHSLCNLLQKRLLEDENVDLAGYDVPHPLAPGAVIFVRTKDGVKPERALRDAAAKARELTKEFSKEFERALKAA